MLEENEEFRRCVIYAFWDQDGYVDGYVYQVLEALEKVSERIVFVSNGELQEESKGRLVQRGLTVLERENQGLDIWAYRTGMMYLGWEGLGAYDEVLLMNNSVMGPVRPLEEVFASMGRKDVDFWGMSRHQEIHDQAFHTANDYGYLPEHIQSWFTVFRRRILCSYEFQFYWEHLPMIETYDDAVLRHEVIFTKYFADMGFSWDVYLHTEDIDDLVDNPTIYYPGMLIEKYGCPFFKRKVFYDRYNDIIQNTVGQGALELYEYLDENRLYDMNLIWDHLLRTCNLYDLFRCMHLNYTLATRMSHREEMREILKKKKTALIIHIYYMDLLDDTYHYVSQMPDVCDIYITTNSEKTQRAIKEKFKDLKCRHMEIRLIENRGRDVSALLVGVKDIVANYEYLCFAHDKKSVQRWGSVGESFSYKCFENTLYSEDYIYNIIETFENHPRLGILCPPEPNHADYSHTIGYAWGPNDNYKITKGLAKEMNITVPIARSKDAIAPYGSFFWFRYDALKAFYDRGWEYDDFPEEPLPEDGTISHAIERLRPFVAQQAGYYTAFVMSDQFSRIEYTNLRTYVEDFNRVFFDRNIHEPHYVLVNEIERRLS